MYYKKLSDTLIDDMANADDRTIRIMAGPGTGKSRALKRRIARLLETGQDPTRILAVTFTRNAAAELVRDLTNVGVSGCERVHASTLHSYCFKLLTEKDVFMYTERTPRIVVTFTFRNSLQFEGKALINDLIMMSTKFGDKCECTKRVRGYEAAWAKLQYDEPGWPTDPIEKLFDQCIREWLRFHNAMLLGELVPEALRFLVHNPTSGASDAFDHVIVDEYQDLNRAEQKIIEHLSKESSLMIVGDADQSIYNFRHAHPEGILDFRDNHVDTRDMPLSYCIRCPRDVVTIAGHLISHNHTSNETPHLKPAPDSKDGEIHVVQWKTPDQEAKGIAEYVCHLINKQGYEPKDMLIMTPRRKLAYKIRNAIEQEKIFVHSYYNEEPLETKSQQRAFALLKLLANGDDRVALRWWLGHEDKTNFSEQYQKLWKYCKDMDKSPRNVLEYMMHSNSGPKGIDCLLSSFKDLTKRIECLSALNLSDLIDTLLPKNHADCAALREIAQHALENSTTITQLHDCIVHDVTQPLIPSDNCVHVMSSHKAKGLSSKVAIVAGCSQGLFPAIDNCLNFNERAAQICEQRRLFYVAITRCKEILLISSFTKIKKGEADSIKFSGRARGKYWRDATASQFIDELGSTAPHAIDGTEWSASGYAKVTRR